MTCVKGDKAIINGEEITLSDQDAMMKMSQRSVAWFAIRKFSIGASQVGGLTGQSDLCQKMTPLKWLETEHTFEPWARTAIDHGRKYEDEATEVFKEEFEFWRRSFSDGHLVKKIEFLDAGMVKPCIGDSNFLHCSPDGLIKVTFTERCGKKPEYILREGKCPYQKRNVHAGEAVKNKRQIKLLPRSHDGQSLDERMPLPGRRAGDRLLLPIHRAHYCQIQFSMALLDRCNITCDYAVYDVVCFPDHGKPSINVTKVAKDVAFGEFLVQQSKIVFQNQLKTHIKDRHGAPSKTRRGRGRRREQRRRRASAFEGGMVQGKETKAVGIGSGQDHVVAM